MINNFDKETAPLTEEEIRAASIIARKICLNIGVEKAVTSEKIIEAMARQNIKLTGARVRKIINHIRRTRLVDNLVASSKGYYVENDQVKLREYVDGLLQRAEAIKVVAESYQFCYLGD